MIGTPGHSPDHVTYSIAEEKAIFSGDVLFQGSIGRTDLPGADHPTLMASIAKLLDTLPGETGVLPGHMQPTTLERGAREQPVPARTGVSKRFQTPRGTYDVLPETALARDRLEATARKIFERAGYGRIETPTFEATELFARGVGEATDVVQKEMFSFGDEEDSYTLRPEGTAPVVRSYMEHGMHKLPQPVKLWYLSSFFRRETPQAGRFRQFWQVGVEAIGSPDPAVDAEVILLLAELLEAIGARDVNLVIASLGQPESRAAYREELIAYLRANEDQLSPDDRRPDRPQPAARLRRQARADAARDGQGAAADRSPAAGGPRPLRRGPGPAARRGSELQRRHDARARAGLLHAHAVRVPVRRAGGGAEHARRRRPLRRPGRGPRRACRRPASAGRRASSGC